ncbi:hypothetical protein HOD20_06260 [archaeon]|jgi:hypothetical protein|nr:hypothetical protein [archaeon]MBT4352106.1 hypothetical protein [archaeon]MBT4648300.1 hypothetical protein [archaeon]MBT6822290.1 hypothetical protein [archaeon]MBT7393059.1 hypothetical protein [archaeon]
MVRGDLEELHDNLKDSFSKIRKDFDEINQKLSVFDLRIQDVEKIEEPKGFDESHIKKIVVETINALVSSGKLNFSDTPKNRSDEKILRKINRTKKYMIANRIIYLAKNKNMTLPEIRDIIAYDEELCSRATFYRYFEKLTKKGQISIVKIDDVEIVVHIDTPKT